ncbi:EGFL8 protein, partial [Polypterus senegalus]
MVVLKSARGSEVIRVGTGSEAIGSCATSDIIGGPEPEVRSLGPKAVVPLSGPAEISRNWSAGETEKGLDYRNIFVLFSSSRVCSKHIYKFPVVYNESFLQPLHTPYLTTCPGHRICSSYRTTYRVSFRQVKKEVSQVSTMCCPGWRKRFSHSYSCDQDINECQVQSRQCGHDCVNTPGSFLCTCRKGYILKDDGRSCEQNEPGDTLSKSLSEEVSQLKDKVTSLEQRLERAVSAFSRFVPFDVEQVRDSEIAEMWSRLGQLDRIDSLSEQILMLEERLPNWKRDVIFSEDNLMSRERQGSETFKRSSRTMIDVQCDKQNTELASSSRKTADDPMASP